MIILILITLSSLSLLSIGLIQDKSDIVASGMSLLVMTGVFGWGMFASISTNYSVDKPAVVSEIIRGRHIVVVCTVCNEAKDNNSIFSNSEVDLINNKTIFYWRVNFNYYNIEIDRKLEFKNK